jgi:DNA-binding transcriptional MerR regulator
MELLGLDERELMTYVQMLGLSPRKDDKTGRLIFTHRDIEALKKASEMKKHGENPDAIARQLAAKQGSAATAKAPQQPAAEPEAPGATATGKPSYMSTVNPNQAIRPAAAAGKDNITVMVEAVSQVKEGILKDLSRLLDDKLSGLDEVVVELIRCKSENDSLKKKLDEAVRSKETLEYELSRFKPVQFGFYRKT